MMLATTMQRKRFADRQNCAHYGVRARGIGLIEMMYWQSKVIRAFYQECKDKTKIDNGFVPRIVWSNTKSCIKAFL